MDFEDYAFPDEGVKFSTREGVEFVGDKYYARLIDRVESAKPGSYIRVGAVQRGSVLNDVGLPAANLYFDVSKINKALSDHGDHLTKGILKQIPEILRNPVVIAEANVENTVNVFGDVQVSDDVPVMVGIVVSRDRSGRNVINKVRTIHARHNYMARITDDTVLYLDENKKRTRNWFQARGNVVPLGGAKYGFIHSIAQSDDSVKRSSGADAVDFEDYAFPDEGVKFSKRQSFGEQIDSLIAETFPRNDHLYVMDTPDVLVQAGLDRLPILMTQKHARSVMKVSGKEKVNYHGLTRTGMKKLPEAIANASLVIKAPGYDNRVIAFTSMKDSAGNVVIAPIEVAGKGVSGNRYITANILTTAYGKANLKEMIVKAIMNDEVLYLDKEKSHSLAVNVGVQFPKIMRNNGFSVNSIAQPDDSVKRSSGADAVDFEEYAFPDEGVKFSTREGVEFVGDKYYARLIDQVESAKPGSYIRVGAVQRGSVLNDVGLPAANLHFDVSKINKALSDHEDHLTKGILKQIPEILRNPVVIAEEMSSGDVNVFGDLFIGKSPVLVGIVVTYNRSGMNVINKIRTVHARRDAASKITEESVLYLDENKKRTQNWFQALGTNLPLGGAKYGFIRSIAQSDDSVKRSSGADAVDFEDYAFPDEDVKYSLRDYSYDELINKPDMPIVSVDTGQNITREDAVKAGRANVVQYAEKFDANGAPTMMVDDLGKYVYVGAKAMRHGLDRRANYQNGVITRIGDILKNSIVINEANPKKDGVKNTWILMGLARDSEGNLIYIRSIVNQSTFEVEDMAAMYAVLGKKSRTGRVIATDANAKARGVPANPTISVAEMLEGVKDYFSDVLSADVVKRLGMKDRQTSEFTPQLRYQLRDPYQISNREILANALEGAAQNETERDWLKRYKKKARALGEKQMRLEDINARIVSLRKSENTLENRETIRKLEAGAKVLSDSIQRADKEMLKLESFQPLREVMKRERAAWREKARATMNERISEYRAGQREKVRERIQAVRESEAEKRKRAVEHTREVGQRRVERLKESEMKAKYKARILKDSATMREWLTRPTTKGHVPEFLRGPLGAFMESLDFTSDRALRGGDPTQADRKMLESMESMRRALASVKKQQSDIDDGKAAFSGYLDLPGGFAEEFDDLTERIKQTLQQGGTDIPINRMTGEQLKSLSRMIRAINTSVRNMNRLLANAKYESAVRAADSTMNELAKLGDKVNANTILDKTKSFMDWTNATPYYVFKRFGDGGKAIFEGLMDGWGRLAFNSKELIDHEFEMKYESR